MTDLPQSNSPGGGLRRWYTWLWDERVLQVLAQLLFAAIIAIVGYSLYNNMANALAKQGLKLGFSFLNQISGFDISIKYLAHSRSSTNLTALEVGVINTIIASVISIILSTILGVIFGVMRVSKNFLVNRIAWLYIEIFRNVPLLLVIIASYAIYVFNLPNVKESIVLPGPSFMSNRGLYTPKLIPNVLTQSYLMILLVILVAAIFAARWIVKRYKLDGFIGSMMVLGTLIVLGTAVWLLMPSAPFGLEIPVKKGLNYTGGISLPPEFIGIIIGLVMGSAPFTADTVRAGLQSVSKGQIEASRALGMSDYQTMRLVIFPQAMRVIVPPMTSNYLSLTKNSSLASVIAYPELMHISSTITSQTGRAVEMMVIVMLIYGTLSLFTSLFMNWYNNRVKIVER